MRIIMSGVMLCLASVAMAQFGVRLNYGISQAPKWEELVAGTTDFADADFFGSGYTIGIDYWLRLPQKRIEFFPEVRYSRYSTSSQIVALGQDVVVNSNSIALIANTHFYVLDFLGDCDCPTFSKRGGLMKKGFFFSINPGIYYHQKSSNFIAGKLESISPVVGIGAGLDMGISDLITITPTVQYSIGFNDKLDGAAQILNLQDQLNLESSSFRQWLFGIRVGLRPDYKN